VPVPGLENKEGKFIDKNINNILFFDGIQLWCRTPTSGGGVIPFQSYGA